MSVLPPNYFIANIMLSTAAGGKFIVKKSLTHVNTSLFVVPEFDAGILILAVFHVVAPPLLYVPKVVPEGWLPAAGVTDVSTRNTLK